MPAWGWSSSLSRSMFILSGFLVTFNFSTWGRNELINTLMSVEFSGVSDPSWLQTPTHMLQFFVWYYSICSIIWHTLQYWTTDLDYLQLTRLKTSLNWIIKSQNTKLLQRMCLTISHMARTSPGGLVMQRLLLTNHTESCLHLRNIIQKFFEITVIVELLKIWQSDAWFTGFIVHQF